MIHQVYEVQDFIKIACGRDHRGCVPNKRKRWIAALARESTRLHWILGTLCPETSLGRALRFGERAPSPEALQCGKNVVYVRVNLSNNDMYVGETEDFEQRVETHYMRTLAHMVSDRRCKGCSEHAKYNKHGSVHASGWLMVPVRMCASRGEALLLERLVDRRLKLNVFYS